MLFKVLPHFFEPRIGSLVFLCIYLHQINTFSSESVPNFHKSHPSRFTKGLCSKSRDETRKSHFSIAICTFWEQSFPEFRYGALRVLVWDSIPITSSAKQTQPRPHTTHNCGRSRDLDQNHCFYPVLEASSSPRSRAFDGRGVFSKSRYHLLESYQY